MRIKHKTFFYKDARFVKKCLYSALHYVICDDIKKIIGIKP